MLGNTFNKQEEKTLRNGVDENDTKEKNPTI